MRFVHRKFCPMFPFSSKDSPQKKTHHHIYCYVQFLCPLFTSSFTSTFYVHFYMSEQVSLPGPGRIAARGSVRSAFIDFAQLKAFRVCLFVFSFACVPSWRPSVINFQMSRLSSPVRGLPFCEECGLIFHFLAYSPWMQVLISAYVQVLICSLCLQSPFVVLIYVSMRAFLFFSRFFSLSVPDFLFLFPMIQSEPVLSISRRFLQIDRLY